MRNESGAPWPTSLDYVARVNRSIVGETLSQFVERLRFELAVRLPVEK